MAKGINFHHDGASDVLEYYGKIKVVGKGLLMGTIGDFTLDSSGTLSSGEKVLSAYAPSSIGNKHLCSLSSAGTGNTLYIDTNGNGISVNIDAESSDTTAIINVDSVGGTNSFQLVRNDFMTSGAVCLKLNGSYLWVDAVGKLRIAAWYPINDLSGAIVGTQA
jgi:hypothetical protein